MATAAPYLEPTQAAGGDLFMRGISGPLTMLNLLRFRPQADYAASPELAPPGPITGAEAFAAHGPYLAGLGHRTAALEDSRLLPLVERAA